ncbi:MAG: hypothetical protein PVH12_04985 [Candidatus Bathyarchaeota archaeon]|jgi:hypothetical protein
MLGCYDNFPINVHQIATFNTYISKSKLQQGLTRLIYRLNKEKLRLEDVAHLSIPQCTVVFEFGIAESKCFNYLDKEEIGRILKIAKKKPFRVMDFFCALRYYKKQNGEKRTLKFDYYMLRFTFQNNLTGIQVFHEKGPRHVSPEELVNLIGNKIGQMFTVNLNPPIET